MGGGGGGGGSYVAAFHYHLELFDRKPDLEETVHLARRDRVLIEDVFVEDAAYLERALVEDAGVECPFERPTLLLPEAP
jgi:hypothetical protein